MNVLIIIEVERAVQLQRVIKPLRLVTQLICNELFWIVCWCLTEEHEVVTACSVTCSRRGVEHHVVIHVVVKIQTEGRLCVFSVEWTIEAHSDRNTTIHREASWCRLAKLIQLKTKRVARCSGFGCLHETTVRHANSERTAPKRNQPAKITFRVSEQILFSDEFVFCVTQSHGQRELIIDFPDRLRIGRESLTLCLRVIEQIASQGIGTPLNVEVRIAAVVSSPNANLEVSAWVLCSRRASISIFNRIISVTTKAVVANTGVTRRM